ncbi:MAG: hypothetical protein KOO69_01770 [Victivallales bacterium]|nr:hypothetical protein [Victivallales bacterium]
MRKTITRIKAIVKNNKVTLSWYKNNTLFNDASTDEFDNFRIYRKEEDFVFGEDYEEFFLNNDGTDAKLIFQGSLEASNNRKYMFEDDSVAIGLTYSYFIQTKTSCRMGPVPVRVRDPEVWWSYEKMMSRLRNLCEQSNGLARLSVCGRTVKGRDIPCLEVGSGSKTLGFVGLIHGGESGPELIIPAISTLLDKSPGLFQDIRIVAIPAVNIDAREEMAQGTPWYIRTNHQGVDLNRNFPAQWETIEYGYGLDSSDTSAVTYRGSQPASAPETQAVMSVFESNPPDIVFSFHWLASICGLPAGASISAKDDAEYALKCKNIIKSFAKGFSPDLDFAEHWFAFFCTAGSLSSWLYDFGKIPGFDLEQVDNQDAKISRVDQTDRALILDYQERHTNALKEVMIELAKT